MTHLRFALAQIDTCVGDLDGNADKIMHYAHLAAHEGAHVVVFPEMTLTGYPIEDLALRRTFRKAAWDKANWLATELEADGLGDLYVAVGTVGTDHASDKPRNRMVVLHDGMVWAGYDKHFLPNYGVFDEFRIFAAGDRTVVLDIDGVRIGVAICEDIWQDGGPVARLADEHIDVLMTMNGSPYEEGKTHTRYDLAVRRAAEVGAPMIYVNQVGGQDDLVFDGGSFVVDRDGTLLERSPMFMEHLGLFDLDTDAEHQTTGDIADLPDPDEEVYTACVLGLKDYMAKNRFSGVCLGLSGGIDSALVAAMAADACGGRNVHGISMPSMYSSIGSKDDAADLAANIGNNVYATGDATVQSTDLGQPRRGYGKQILLNHQYGYQTRYAHLSQIFVKPGEKVVRGQLIGKVGNTGGVTGPHLHYEVIHMGQVVNPINYFNRNMTNEEYERLMEQMQELNLDTFDE